MFNYSMQGTEMPQVHASLLGSFSVLLNEIKIYHVAIYIYQLAILNSVKIMVNNLIPMALQDQI